MKQDLNYEIIVLRVLLVVFLLTGIYVLIAGRNVPSAQTIQFQEQTFNKGWFYLDSAGSKIPIESLPARIPSVNKRATIYHTIAPFEGEKSSLCFYTHLQNVTIRLNDDIIYDYKVTTVPKTIMVYRSIYNFVDFPQTSKLSLLSIETEAIVNSTAGEFSEIFVGNSAQIFLTIFFRHFDSFLLGVMFIVISFFLFGTNHLFSHNNKNDRTLLYLSCLTLLAGFWQLDDTNVLLLFTGYLPLLWCFKYLTQLLLPIFTFLLVKSIHFNGSKRFMGFLFWLITIVLFTQYVLQMTGIKALTNTIFASQTLYLVIFIYAFISLSNEDWAKDSWLKYIFLLSMIISIIIFAFTAFSLFHNRFFSSIMSFGLGFTFISMILLTYKKELTIFEEASKAETYKKLAFIDIPTGVNNKTAWYTLVDTFDEKNYPKGETCLIIFDMNNLKKVNDSMGHLVGDKMIKAFCTCLVKTIDGKGKIYRIGGDEFICILNSIFREDVISLLAQFDEAVKNQEESEYKFSAAYGYEFFTPHSPSDFKQALKNADKKMYSKKLEMKLARS